MGLIGATCVMGTESNGGIDEDTVTDIFVTLVVATGDTTDVSVGASLRLCEATESVATMSAVGGYSSLSDSIGASAHL